MKDILIKIISFQAFDFFEGIISRIEIFFPIGSNSRTKLLVPNTELKEFRIRIRIIYYFKVREHTVKKY